MDLPRIPHKSPAHSHSVAQLEINVEKKKYIYKSLTSLESIENLEIRFGQRKWGDEEELGKESILSPSTQKKKRPRRDPTRISILNEREREKKVTFYDQFNFLLLSFPPFYCPLTSKRSLYLSFVFELKASLSPLPLAPFFTTPIQDLGIGRRRKTG